MHLSPLFIILGIPGLVWAASYLFLVRAFGKWNLFPVKIHESGKYTLLETIFYYNHFLRELPIDTLLAFAILWSYSAADVRLARTFSDPISSLSIALLVLFLAFVLTGSTLKVGLRSTLADLFQFRERDDLVNWGAHWQMHFLSTAALLLLLSMPGTLFPGPPRFLPDLIILFGIFLIMSLVLGVNSKALSHRRWLLHGGREVFTYFFIAAIPAFSVFPAHAELGGIKPVPLSVVMAAVFADINIYFLYVFRQGKLDEEAQSNRGLIFLLSSHFFEHVLDYVYILLLVMTISSIR